MNCLSVLRGKAVVCLAIAAMSLLGAQNASAGILIDCVHDGYVAMGGMVTNTTNSYLLPGNPNSAPQSDMETYGYAFLKFDSADLPTIPVTSAVLKLDVIALQDGMTWPTTGASVLSVYGVNADVQSISSATAAGFRSQFDSVSVDFETVTGAGVITLDVTDLVNDWIVSGNNYGLVLTTPGGLMPRLNSAQTTSGAAPSIEANYAAVPEPASLGVLLCGSLGLLVRRKRGA